MSESKFCTVVNCMDGRTQLQVNEYLRKKYDVEYVDTITEAGPIKCLAAADAELPTVQSICARLDVSVHKHGSRAIAVVAHHDCAGNPVEMDQQYDQAKKSVSFLFERYPECDVTALWVSAEWQVEEIL